MNHSAILHQITAEQLRESQFTYSEAEISIILRMRDYLLSKTELSAYGCPIFKAASAIDMAFVLLFIDFLKTNAKRQTMADVFGVTILTCQRWTERLRDEAACDVHWEVYAERQEGKAGMFVVGDYGVYDQRLLLPFVPYVHTIIEAWKADNVE